MKLTKLTFGTMSPEGPVAKSAVLHAGLTVIVVDDPATYARAIRETLTEPARTTADTLPFVSVEAAHDDIELTVADDGASGIRMMTRGRARAIPEVLEIHASDSQEVIDGGFDVIFSNVARATGAESIEVVAPALAHFQEEKIEGALSPDARSFLEASARAQKLAAAVRAVDDEMTASVVPDWLWIATALGGVGILCTAIAFLYPHLRVVMVLALVVVSVVGFSMYGWRAFGEMKTRGRLQDERGGLRERRETARSEARVLSQRLSAEGVDPDALLRTHGDAPPPRAAPAVVAIEAVTEAMLSAITATGRQVVLFAKRADGAPDTAIAYLR